MTERRVAAVAGCVLVIGAAVGGYYLYGQWNPRVPARAPQPQGKLAGAAAALRATPENARRALWVLSVGVSRYNEPGIALQFADADARAFAAEIEAQRGRPLYRKVETLVLTNEQVTRESIINGIKSFLGKAGSDDVAAIFMAGHGVQEPVTGSYYFLPHSATSENLDTEGLRMSDFDEMMKRLQHNVHRVVVLLDTCHAGALQLSSLRASRTGEDLAAGIDAAEGLYILAAAKEGEESKEFPDLGHGAFTYALLEGLRGEADTNREGLIYVTDLFRYVAHRVPPLTNGSQHPYQKNEGTDLILAIPATGTQEPEATVAAAPETTPAPMSDAIEVLDFQNARVSNHDDDWIGKTVSNALFTALSDIPELKGNVYWSQFSAPSAQANVYEARWAARQRGRSKIIAGSFVVDGAKVRIDANIIETEHGASLGSIKKEGEREGVLNLVDQLALEMARRLQVEVSQSEQKALQPGNRAKPERAKQLLEGEGVIAEPAPPRLTPNPHARGTAFEPQSRSPSLGNQFSLLGLFGVRATYGAEPPAETKAEVENSLQEYKSALEHKDVNGLALLYVSFSDRQRQSVSEYFENVDDLKVEISDVSVELRGADVSVSYTRHDRFIDKETGKPARLDVRLTKVLIREGGKWKIAGGA
jgi:TolB-like protein